MPRTVAVAVRQKKNLTELSDKLQKRKPRATLQSAQTSVSFAEPTKTESDLLKLDKNRNDCYMNVLLHKHKSGIMMLAIRPVTNEPIAAWRDQNQVICPVRSSYAPLRVSNILLLINCVRKSCTQTLYNRFYPYQIMLNYNLTTTKSAC